MATEDEHHDLSAYHEFKIPKDGAERVVLGDGSVHDWGDDFDHNWSYLDSRLVVKAPSSERTSATAVQGLWWLETDNLDLYYYDGTDWNLIAGSTAGTDRVDIEDDGASVATDVAVLDFVDDFDVSGSSSEVSVSLTNDSVTVAGGDGLKDGGSVALGGSVTLSVDVSDFAGTGLEGDGSENLRIAAAAAGDGLSGGGGSPLSVNVNDLEGNGIESSLGDLQVDTTAIAGSGLDGSSGTALDVSPDSLSVTAGDGLSGGGSAALGGSVTLSVDVSEFAGNGLKGDGSENLAVEPSEFAGAGLADDGSDNLGLDVSADSETTLSGGSATVDTGVAAGTTDVLVALSPRDGADIAASIEDNGTNFTLHFEENTTSIGNPTVGWSIIEVA
jgi:hypothetical protein